MSIVVVNHVSLDGVMQAPARPDEDERGGFAHGGWAMAAADEEMGVSPAQPESPYARRLEASAK